MDRVVRAWPAVASAALVLLAFPPFHLGLLVFVALVPWLASLREASGWGAFRSGYVFGIVFWAGQMSWLQPLVQRWTGDPVLSAAPYLLAMAIGALYFSAMAWIVRTCWAGNAIWLVPVAWAGIEVIRSIVPLLAFPWGLLATPLTPYPATIQLAYFGSIYAVSAWVVLANVCFALALRNTPMAAVRSGGLVWGALLGVSLVRYISPQSGASVTVTAGQPGIDLAFGSRAGNSRDIGEAVGKLQEAASAHGSKLLVLPEGLVGALAELPPELPFRVAAGLPVLFGAQRGSEPGFQTAFAYDGTWRFADKRRLVVFGEYVPFRDQLPFLRAFELPTGDLNAADRTSTVEVGGFSVGPLLCFESLFYDVGIQQAKNGAQLLAAMVIDDWYMGTVAPDQLKFGAVWRAVETGLPIVRVGSLGYTYAADARGNIVARARLRRLEALKCDLVLPAERQYFPGIEAFPYLFGASVFVPLLLRRRRPPRVDGGLEKT